MKFDVIRPIGRGGFGIVEEVASSDGQRFARKTFRPASHIPPSAHDRLRTRFRREVKTQAELGGQEIIPIVHSDLSSAEPWFVMPLADMTYESQIAIDRATGKVNVDAVADVLNGLQFLHDLGYVHRDLNPKNILLHEGRWKLSDFGAVLPPSGNSVTLTENTVIYTELYCSPEQRSDFHNAQAPADVFALGCILHDIFGTPPRTPYSQQHAPGPVGYLIEKCTEVVPAKRPTVKVLRAMLLETLVEIGGQCKIEDKQAETWLTRLEDVDQWTDTMYHEFAIFFAQLDTSERTPGNAGTWVYSLSTPFLTRLPADALLKLVQRQDGISAAIVDKYCEWAKSTNFLFHFADTVCERLVAIFEGGTLSNKAQAIVALLELGASHNRWHVMREGLQRCSPASLPREAAKRVAIEIRTDEVEGRLKRCVEEMKWDLGSLPPEIAKLCA